MIYHESITSDTESVIHPFGSADVGGPDLAAFLGIRRDGREQADSARSLLLTLLGELARPAGGAAWTQSMIEGLGLMGVSPQAARLAISRLAERGWLAGTRSGRRTRWEFTPALARLLDEGAARIYSFGTQDRPWDGRWLLVFVSVPERQRRLRSMMAVRLGWVGFGSLAKGVWVSPWPDREAEALHLMGDLGVEGAMALTTDPTGTTDRAGIVGRSWDLDDLRGHYRRFLDGLDGNPPSDGASSARDLLSLVHSWRRFPVLDPGLPVELLPDGWPAAEAAARFAHLRSRWGTAAAGWWRETEEAFS
jgi:phenylacetic acid degradation operon negative regulatory protein